MEYSIPILGRNIVHDLQARASAPVVVIGGDRYTRVDLSAVTCFNFVAAARLSAAVAALAVKHTRDLYDRIDPDHLAVPGIGAFAFAVLGACFEIKGVGTLETWILRTRQKGEPLTTIATMKRHIDQTTTRTTRQERRGDSRRAAPRRPIPKGRDLHV